MMLNSGRIAGSSVVYRGLEDVIRLAEKPHATCVFCPGERHHGQHAQRPPPAPGPAGRDLRHSRRLRADAAVHAADGRQCHQAAPGPP